MYVCMYVCMYTHIYIYIYICAYIYIYMIFLFMIYNHILYTIPNINNRHTRLGREVLARPSDWFRDAPEMHAWGLDLFGGGLGWFRV